MRFPAAILLAALVFAAGCVSDEGGGVPSPTTLAGSTNPTLKATTTTGEVLGPDEEPVEPPTESLVKVPANITNCLTLENASVRDVCFYDAAGRAKDMSACEKISDRNLQLKCRARIVDNPEYCDGIDVSSQRDWCYRMMAFRWNKIKYCKMIFAQTLRDDCVWDYVRDKEADPFECFDMVNANLKDQCIYYHVGLDRIKPALCYLIVNETMEGQCNSTYLNPKPRSAKP